VRFGAWTFTDRPRPGWTPPRRMPRVAAVRTVDGNVVHSHTGHIADELFTLDWDHLNASPAISIVQSEADASAITAKVGAGERVAAPIAKPSEFIAVGAARLYLRLSGSLTGEFSVEIWSADASGEPVAKLGTIGAMDVADLTGSFAGVEFWGLSAFEVDPEASGSVGALLVVNGDSLSGTGAVEWGGASSAGDSWWKYSGGSWSETSNQYLAHTVWSSGPFNTWLGLCAAGGGGTVETLDVEDGQRYRAILLSVDGRMLIMPRSLGGDASTPPATAGLAQGVSATFQIVSEVN